MSSWQERWERRWQLTRATSNRAGKFAKSGYSERNSWAVRHSLACFWGVIANSPSASQFPRLRVLTSTNARRGEWVREELSGWLVSRLGREFSPSLHFLLSCPLSLVSRCAIRSISPQRQRQR